MAHRGGLLDADADAAARGVFDRLFGLVGEAAVVPETVNEEQSGYGERASSSTGADTKVNTSGAAAHLRLVIFVSLRTAASPVAPSALMWLRPRLRARGRMGNGERVGVSMGADTKANTSEAAAHLRLVIFVSLRMAASAVAPSSLMLLCSRLPARGRMGTVRACQWALTQKRTLRAGSRSQRTSGW